MIAFGVRDLHFYWEMGNSFILAGWLAPFCSVPSNDMMPLLLLERCSCSSFTMIMKLSIAVDWNGIVWAVSNHVMFRSVPFGSENIKIAYLKLHLVSDRQTDRWLDAWIDRYWIFNPDGIGELEMILFKMQMALLHPHSTRLKWNGILHTIVCILDINRAVLGHPVPRNARDDREIEQLHTFNLKCECDAMHGCLTSNITIAYLIVLILKCNECVHWV